MRPQFALAPLVLLLAGCASGGPEPGALPPGPRLFVSPAGEPFRPGPGGADGLAAWFDAADTSRDGRLDRSELIADALRFFAVLDTNADGGVDGFESARYERDIAPEIAGEGAPGSPEPEAVRAPPAGGPIELGRRPPAEARGLRGAGGPGREFGRGALVGAAPFGVTGEPQPIRAADQDLSQTVTEAEFGAHAARHFVRLDTDRDGSLTQVELAAQVRPSLGALPRGRGRPPGGGPRR